MNGWMDTERCWWHSQKLLDMIHQLAGVFLCPPCACVGSLLLGFVLQSRHIYVRLNRCDLWAWMSVTDRKYIHDVPCLSPCDSWDEMENSKEYGYSILSLCPQTEATRNPATSFYYYIVLCVVDPLFFFFSTVLVFGTDCPHRFLAFYPLTFVSSDVLDVPSFRKVPARWWIWTHDLLAVWLTSSQS